MPPKSSRLTRPLFLAIGLTLSAALPSSIFANTADNVNTGSSDLTAAGTYSGGLPGTTSDVTFLGATTYFPNTFTLNTNAFNLSIGTLNDLDATQSLTIQNQTTGSTSTITLNGGANSVAPAAGDLLYVASGGTLNIGGGAGTLNLALAASGNFDILGTANISSTISGAFAITKTGGGTLSLSGANTYSGGTTVTSGGTVQLGSSSVGTAGTVGSNGSLTSGAFGTGSVIFSNAGAVLDLNGQTLGNRFSSNVTGLTIGNTSASTATISGAMDGSLTGNTISDFNVGGNNGDINWTGQISRVGSSLGFTKIGSDTVTFSGTAQNVGVGTQADQVKVSAGTLGLGKTGTSAGWFADSVTVQGGTLKFRPDLGTVSGGNPWGGQINANLQMTSGTIDLFGSSGQNSRQQQFYGTGGTVTNTSTTAGVLGIAARNSVFYTFGGTIQDGTGTVGIDFTNSGATGNGRINQFTGTNTYSGTTSISYGTFELGNALAAQNSTLIVNGASGLGTNSTIAYTTTNPLAFANGIGTFTIGGLSGAGNIALTDIGFTNANVAATPASVTLQIGSNLATNAAPGAYTGVISDGTVAGGKVVKIGTSTEAFNNANTYTGGTTILNGALTTTNASGFGAGTITLGDTTGTNNAALSANTGGTVTNAITVAAGSSGTRTLASTNGGGSTATFSGPIALNANLILAQNFTIANSGTLAVTGQITGSGNLLVTNTSGFANNVVLSGNNASTFTGNVSVTNGMTLFTSATALGTANTLTIDSTSQVNSTGQSLTVAGLNSTGTGGSVVISNSTGQTLTLGGGGTYGYAGVISNAGNVTKSGGGTQTLSGANTYTGATTVTAGMLSITGSTASGAVSVSNGGTILGGTGTIGGAVTVNSGAILLGGIAGTPSGALTLSTTPTLNSGSIIELTLGTGNTHSSLGLPAGSNPFNAAQMFTFLGLQAGTYDNIVTGVASGINTSGWTVTNGSGYTFSFTDDGSNIDLSVAAVPEPSTWTIGILLVGVLGWRMHRKSGCKARA